MKGYYHVSSHGLERNDIFKSREDFIAGMNYIAISVLGFDIMILCFCLMSNHFHFVLYGTLEECRRFSEEYKRRCAIRMRLRSGEVHGLKDVEIRLGMSDNVTLTDQELLTQMQELIAKEYRKNSIVQLSMDQRLKLCLLLKRNFNAGVKQIAR